MPSEELTKYVKDSRDHGLSEEDIRKTLTGQGWKKTDIDQALGGPSKFYSPTPGSPKTPPSPSSESVTPIKHEAERITRSKSSLPGVLLILFIVSLFIGGGAFAYFKFFKRPAPQEVIGKMFLNLIEYETYEIRVNLLAEVDGSLPIPGLGDEVDENDPESSKTRLKISADSSFDRTDPNTLKSNTTLDVDIASGNDELTPFAGIEFRSIGKKKFLRLTKGPDLGFFSLSPLEDKWIAFDPDAAKGLLGLGASDKKDKLDLSDLLNEENRPKVLSAYLNNLPLLDAEDLGDEKIGVVDSFHYALTVNERHLTSFILELNALFGDKSIDEKELRKSIEDELSKSQLSDMEIWISKKEFFPTKFSSSVNTEEDRLGGDGDLELFFDFNRPLSIEEPDGALSIEEVMGELLGGAMSGDAEDQDTKRVADIRQIQTALELAWSETGTYPQTDEPIVIGVGYNLSLCIKGDSIVFDSRCSGTVFMSRVPSDSAYTGLSGSPAYTYESSDPKNYSISFTLENNTGELKDGPNCATPDGIVSGPCGEPGESMVKEKEGGGGFTIKLEKDGDGFKPADPLNSFEKSGALPSDVADLIDDIVANHEETGLYPGVFSEIIQSIKDIPGKKNHAYSPGNEKTTFYLLIDVATLEGSKEIEVTSENYGPDALDGDGLSYADELRYGTDPNNADTDGDGFSDGDEVAGGFNPLGDGKL